MVDEDATHEEVAEASKRMGKGGPGVVRLHSFRTLTFRD
jgi:hypothetical protein